MKLTLFLGFLLVGLAATAPTTKQKELVVNKDFFPDSLKVYDGEHDIVKICVPLNKLNFDDIDSTKDDQAVTIFFVEADINGAEVVDQGLYIRKDNEVTKLLDHGRDIAVPHDDESKVAYFAAKDGVYVYNSQENKAEKYGTINDDLIGIEMGNSSNGMYVLSADKKVYKITEDGNKKEQMNDIKNAEQIVLDNDGNLFYVDSEKKVYIVNNDGVRQIQGLPENYSKIKLIRPPFINEKGIPIIVDKKLYELGVDGALKAMDIVIDTDITAYALEATIVQYYGYQKKIYEYNLLTLIVGDILKELREFLDTMGNEIRNIGSMSRSEFRNK